MVTFDPNGYYFPDTSPRIGNFEIQSFGLHDFASPPENANRPGASVQVKKVTASQPMTYFTNSATATVDTVFFECTVKGLGTVRFDGVFLDKKGSFWNREDIDPNTTIVLVGRLKVIQGRHEVYSKLRKFTYFGGD